MLRRQGSSGSFGGHGSGNESGGEGGSANDYYNKGNDGASHASSSGAESFLLALNGDKNFDYSKIDDSDNDSDGGGYLHSPAPTTQMIIGGGVGATPVPGTPGSFNFESELNNILNPTGALTPGGVNLLTPGGSTSAYSPSSSSALRQPQHMQQNMSSPNPPQVPLHISGNDSSQHNSFFQPGGSSNNTNGTNGSPPYQYHPAYQQQQRDDYGNNGRMGGGQQQRGREHHRSLTQMFQIQTQSLCIKLKQISPIKTVKDAMIFGLMLFIIFNQFVDNDNTLLNSFRGGGQRGLNRRNSIMRGFRGGGNGGSSPYYGQNNGLVMEDGGGGRNNNVDVYGYSQPLVPSQYDTLGNLRDPYVAGRETPLFWHIPRTGAVTLQDILSHCRKLVEASQIGTTNGHDQESTLDVWNHADGGRYVNVDTTTPEGILRAKEQHLVESGLADVIYSSYLYEASALFTPQQKGRCFTILRHPVERAASTYYMIQDNVRAGKMDVHWWHSSIEEYARSPHVENNWMTRFLSNRMEGPMQPNYLEIAKEVLKTKCLIGLTSKFGESVERFETYFGWRYEDQQNLQQDQIMKMKGCQQRLVEVGDNRHEHPPVTKDSEAWNLLVHQNTYDIKLYEYALDLFEKQGKLLGRTMEEDPYA